jgi:LmbE family N-acetylglucosaminyl deacetylase
MDDEVFGCGGVLAKHIRAGAHVTVVYMTDGRKGNPSLYGRGLSEQKIWEAEAELSARRKLEAQQAASIVGVQELLYLDFPDGGLPRSQEVVERIKKILQRVEPDRVYLPSLLDHHADHWQTNCVFRDAITHGTKTLPDFSCWGYEIWPPLYANTVVDISDVIDTKKKAIEAFQSQLRNVDYARVVMSLNSYRSFFRNGAQGYAEAFFSCRPADYLSLFRRMGVFRESLRTPWEPLASDVLISSRD